MKMEVETLYCFCHLIRFHYEIFVSKKKQMVLSINNFYKLNKIQGSYKVLQTWRRTVERILHNRGFTWARAKKNKGQVQQ